MYILDEPSIGMHQPRQPAPAGNPQQLRDLGNTVIVVGTMRRRSRRPTCRGPGSGAVVHGGHLCAGQPRDIAATRLIPANTSAGKRRIEVPGLRIRPIRRARFRIVGARRQQPRAVTTQIRWACSPASPESPPGKSTLIVDTLFGHTARA